MKRLNLYLSAIALMGVFMLQACDDDNSLGKFYVRMATVHAIGGSSYYLETDNGKTLWPSATAIPQYKPVDGQRVIADYTPLGTLQEYDEAIRVNYLYNVLTKQVEELTAENEEVFGNDPARIRAMWIGGNYLNIQFEFNVPYQKAHRVSLVWNTTTDKPLIDDEGYINLEYRYNNQADISPYVRRSFVSYNLLEYGPNSTTLEGVAGLKVKINTAADGEKDIVFNYINTADVERTIDYSTDVVNEGVN